MIVKKEKRKELNILIPVLNYTDWFLIFNLGLYSSSSSVAQSCPTLCDPMNHSTPGLPVHHQLLEFTQTHVHRVSDTIQPSHPLSSPSPPAPVPPSIKVFSNESALRMRWPKYWNFSFSISPSIIYAINLELILMTNSQCYYFAHLKYSLCCFNFFICNQSYQ